MPVPIVFLSFASEDAAWKINFVNPAWFSNILGVVKTVDYQAGDAVPFGPINDWAAGKIHSAAVFVAFVSESYIQKEIPLLEWHTALSEVRRKELIFVPILLDAAAKRWWIDLKERGQLRDLGGDYAYADFTDGSGKPCQILTTFGPVDIVVRRISELARLIKENLQPHEAVASDPGPVRSTVVLGHPTAVSDPDVATQSLALRNLLAERGRPPLYWNDRWRTSAASRQYPDNFSSKGAIFIQPTAPGDAGDLAQDRQKLQIWINHALNGLKNGTSVKDHQTVLWLPASLSDQVFIDAATQSHPDSDVLLRHDDPESLVRWLKNQIEGPQQLPDIPVLTLEEVDDAVKLRDALHSSFKAVVDDVIHPAPERWTFKGPMLINQIDQISKLGFDRAIVAIHDLNTGIAKGPLEARIQLEQKLGAVGRDVELAIKSAGRSDLKLFWTALLVQKAEQLPWVKYPSPSRFEQWCLLPFESSKNEEAEVLVHPRQAETDVFRSYLRDWVDRHA
jgi:hypothetical protein